jgi:large subunit ribosomal protein L22
VKENQPTLLTRWTNKGANQELPEKFSKNAIITDKAGRRYAVVDLLKPLKHKLKPKLVRRRILQLRTYEGKERDIRHSPWRLQLICRHVAGLPYEEAMTQLAFLNKVKAPLVKKVLKRTASTAFDRDGLQPSQLEVAECFATHGTHLKRVRIMGRGRQGIMHHRFSHMRVVLREIDFVLKIFSAKTMGEKRRWIERQMRAQEDYDKAKAERDELERLERLAALKQKEKEEKNKK